MSKSKTYLGIVKFGDHWIPNYIIIAPSKVIAKLTLESTMKDSELLNKRRVKRIKVKEPTIYHLHPFTEGIPQKVELAVEWAFDEEKIKEPLIKNDNRSETESLS